MQQEAPRKLFAAKGETVTCVQGHPVCSIARDVYVGDPRSEDMFCDWQQPKPDNDITINKIRCAVCRGVWIRRAPIRLHFEGGWR